MLAKQALEGIRILDFSWVIAGPYCTKILAEHGATVIKVESSKRVDEFRNQPPFAGGIAGINRTFMFSAYNNDKNSITLDLRHPQSPEIIKGLILWADVVIENFRPGTMERIGLDYGNLRKIKPDIIMLRTALQGQTGPNARQAGWGQFMVALSGFPSLTGWPDRAPSALPTAYTDFTAPFFGVIAILGAIDYRRRTGKGQYIDLSQLEAGLSFLAPAILAYSANKEVPRAMGNRSPHIAPHGAFRCSGEDAWCAIAVSTDEEWEDFCKVIGQPEWTKDPKFNSLLSRKANEDELEKLIEEWTIEHSAKEVMAKMQEVGIAAGVVQNSKQLWEDPQLAHRNHFCFLQHPEMGLVYGEAPSFKLSETPAQLRKAAPCRGENTQTVCQEILGMDDEEFVKLLAEGVFT